MADDLYTTEAKMPEGTSMVDAADDIMSSALPREPAVPAAEDGTKDAAPLPSAKEPTAPSAAPPADPKPAETPVAPAAEGAPVDPAAAAAPDTLSGAVKDMWAKGLVPPEVKADIIKREGDFKKGMDELRPPAELGNGFLNIVGPYLNVMKQYNVSPVQHTEDLLKYHAILMFGDPQQKAEIIHGLARDAGIDLRALAAGQVQNLPGETLALQREIAQLKGTVSSVTSRFTAQDAKELEVKIDKMASDQENFPHFWSLAPAMIEMLNENPRLNLDVAYRTALAANQQLYGSVMDSKAQKLAQKELDAARQRADAARKAKGVSLESSSNVRPASHGPKGGDMSIDDMVADAYESMQSP